jgi:hypothetical protein
MAHKIRQRMLSTLLQSHERIMREPAAAFFPGGNCDGGSTQGGPSVHAAVVLFVSTLPSDHMVTLQRQSPQTSEHERGRSTCIVKLPWLLLS